MNTVSSIFQNHLWAIIGTFIAQYVWSAFVSALPAPTAQSSTMYQFWFKFLNILAANLARAQRTAVENSPNWQAAAEKHAQTLQNGNGAPAQPPKGTA